MAKATRLATCGAAALFLGACAGDAPEPAAAPAPERSGAVSASAAAVGGADTLDRFEIREAQALLDRLGYEAGEADGVAGPQSRAAARTFQSRAGTSPTGTFDDALLASLRRSAETSGVAIAAAPPPI